MTDEDMISELVSHEASGLAELAQRDYAKFESRLTPLLTQQYRGVGRKQLIERYVKQLGETPPGLHKEWKR